MSDEQRCSWSEDDDAAWDTECGERFQFNEGGPPENGFGFCPYCGKNLNPVAKPTPRRLSDRIQ